MRITHYLYNAFVIEADGKKIAIDPGGLMLYFLRLTTLIPKSEWQDITHIFVTHGDPDHYWHADRVAAASNAPVICNRSMLRDTDDGPRMLGPRSKGLTFNTTLNNVNTITPGEFLELDDMVIRGIETRHGPLRIQLGPLHRTIEPGPGERIGWGAIGFEIRLAGKTLVNLGDTLLLRDAWQDIRTPDVLMLPIGGASIGNTMDEEEALEACKTIQPKLVIPCHYNCPAFFSRKYNPANEDRFGKKVEDLGLTCSILHLRESVDL